MIWKRKKACFALFASLILLGCAPKPRFPAGEALLRGERPLAPPLPDSLRAELEMTGFQGGRKSTVSAALSALPWSRYKLDLYGLPGMVGASFLWTDTGWTLVLYERDGYLQGYGDTVDLPGLGVGAVPVHDLFACLWGDFFPGDGGARGGVSGGRISATGSPGDSVDRESTGAGANRDSMGAASDSSSATAHPVVPAVFEKAEGGRIRYVAGGVPWVVTLDPRTGLVREAAREDSVFRIAYEDYKLRNGRPVPKRIRVFSRRRPILEIGVGAVEDHPKWKRNPFQIRIPKSFNRLRVPGKG